MISISLIRTYMFCPLKLYLQHNLNKEIEDEMIVNKGIKDLRIDLQDITQRNIRKVKKDMEIPKIEEILSKQVEDYIDTTFEILKEHKTEELEKKEKKIKKQENINPDILNREIENIYNEYKEDLDKLEELRSDIIDETYFNIKLLALKTKKGMNLLDKNGEEITEMFFPTCMYSYLIRDVSLELIGNIDKIEVINGNYIPISLRQSNPPMKGTWDSDAIEIVASAILIEQEFNTYVSAGFVDYLKLGERRIVIINQEQRKSFFRILTNINEILDKGVVPKVKVNLNKCENCEYFEICENNLDNKK